MNKSTAQKHKTQTPKTGVSALEIAKDYLRRGWQPLPIPHRSKNPNFPGWQKFETTEADLPKHFNGKQQNIGISLGSKSKGLADIDLDSPEAIRVADFFLPPTEAEFGRAGNPRSHRLYYCEAEKYNKFNNPLLLASKDKAEREKACVVEFRCKDGLQSVFPGSTHKETGEAIEWSKEGEPLRVSTGELYRATSQLACASLIATIWRDGIRQDLAMALSGALLRNGFDIPAAKNFIKAICFAANDEETSARLQAVEATAQKLERGENIYGFPRLAELTDKKLVETICKWLGIDSRSDFEQGAPKHDYKSATSQSADEEFVPLQAIRMSDVQAEDVSWLWEPFLALQTFNLLEGEEGVGKTFLVCAIACAIASGKGLPLVTEGKHIESSNVLLISAEDSLSHVLKPRLEAMRAPCDKIIAIDQAFTFDAKGLIQLSAVLDEYGPRLVVVDPLFSYTGRINLDRDNDIRAITDQLKRLAEKHNCCIVGIRHIGKSKGLGDSRNAGLNGVGWRASARSALLIGKDPENERVRALCQTKNNLALKFEKSLGFEIRDGEFGWTGESDLSASTMLSALRVETPEEKNEKHDAVAFLRDILSGGEMSVDKVFAEAKKIRISDRTVQRAKSTLNVKSVKHGGTFGGAKGWFWKLPNAEDARAEESGVLQVKTCAKNDINTNIYNNLAEGRQTPKKWRPSAPEGRQKSQSGNLQATVENKASYSGKATEGRHPPESEHLQGFEPIPPGEIYDCSHCGADIQLADETCPKCEKSQLPTF
jgi:rubrerythrin